MSFRFRFTISSNRNQLTPRVPIIPFTVIKVPVPEPVALFSVLVAARERLLLNILWLVEKKKPTVLHITVLFLGKFKMIALLFSDDVSD